MCMGGSPDPSPTPPPPAPAPPPPPPTILQTAANNSGSSEGAGGNAASTTKGRKALRIDLATATPAGGQSGLNIPV